MKARLVGYLSLPKITNSLAVLIIFLSATQLGFHFWPSSAFVYGLRVDYLSPTLHFVDLLIIFYLVFIRAFKLPTTNPPLLTTLVPLLLVNLLFSLNPLATLSWSFHFLLYFSFILSLQPRLILATCYKLLPLTIFFQVALGGLQVWLGHALQGPFYYLGERAINLGSPNVAKSEWLGQIALRAYGTFSHPNALAGWLVIACLIVLTLSRNTKYKILNITLTSLGLLLTQSRSAALAFFGLVIPLYLLHSFRSRLIYYFLLCVPLFFILNSSLIPPRSDLSVTERLSLQKISLNIIRTHPLLGTGASSSLSTYPAVAPSLRLLQPDHNSFTLFLSWFGIVGVLAFLFLLQPTITTQSLSRLLPLLPLLLFDHYLLTSPQGLFILLLYFRVVTAIKSSHAKENYQ